MNEIRTTGRDEMDLLLMVTTLLGGLVVFDLFSISHGADSRDRIGDDWARSARR